MPRGSIADRDAAAAKGRRWTYDPTIPQNRCVVRKAVIQVGPYTVRERPTGGWALTVEGAEHPVGLHDHKDDAIAAAQRYVAEDSRHLRG